MAQHSRQGGSDEEGLQEGFEEKLVQLNRVARVVKGGKVFGFTALMVLGDRNGRVGFGRGKARDVSLARQKALDNAHRNMIDVNLNGDTLYYPVQVKYGATKVYLLPASPGTGIIAGLAVRAILELAGVQNVLTKVYGSTNPNNVVRATFNALRDMQTPQQIAAKRSRNLEEIWAGG